MIIITGASSNHFTALRHLLFSIKKHEPDAHTIVYDLGLTSDHVEHVKAFSVELKKYEPLTEMAWTKVKSGGEEISRRGHYAWKPIIVKQEANTHSGQIVWMDAGNLIHEPLHRLRKVISEQGVYSPKTSGTIRKYTDTRTSDFMGVYEDDFGIKTSYDILEKHNRCAALVAFDMRFNHTQEIVNEWARFASIKNCISPDDVDRHKHRFDQSILSILLERYRASHGYRLISGYLGVTIHNDSLTEDDMAAIYA